MEEEIQEYKIYSEDGCGRAFPAGKNGGGTRDFEEGRTHHGGTFTTHSTRVQKRNDRRRTCEEDRRLGARAGCGRDVLRSDCRVRHAHEFAASPADETYA